jgi:YHS domain-containing protein
MTDLDDLERRVKQRIEAVGERQRLERDRMVQHMNELEMRCQRYTEVADRLVQNVIGPRVERLARCFENAKVPVDRLGRHTALVEFEHTPRFPATASLEFGITRDKDARVLEVVYRLQIRPAYISFKGEDRLCIPVDEVKDEAVTAWVETRLLDAVDTYLQLETADPYQADNQEIDPVCLMRFPRSQASAELEYHGLRYYFCVLACRDRFLEAPERYVTRRPAPEPQP